MSEFSRYLLVPGDFDAPTWLAGARATGLVLSREGPWTIVVSDAAGLADECTTALAYDYAADHGFALDLLHRGQRVAKLRASSEVGHRSSFEPAPWVSREVLSFADARTLAGRLARRDWRHRDVRDLVARLLRFAPASWLSPRDLADERQLDVLRQRFPEAVLVREGVKVAWHAASVAREVEEVEAILDAEERHPVRERTAMGEASAQADLDALSRSFDAAPPLSAAPDGPLEADVDLASCADATEWLSARKRIDPARAKQQVIEELERVVREGRFAEEGERATVVREAAAMMLARVFATQRRTAAESWLASQEQGARSVEERAAWAIAVARFRTASR